MPKAHDVIYLRVVSVNTRCYVRAEYGFAWNLYTVHSNYITWVQVCVLTAQRTKWIRIYSHGISICLSVCLSVYPLVSFLELVNGFRWHYGNVIYTKILTNEFNFGWCQTTTNLTLQEDQIEILTIFL